jgi:hypothetical protein
MKKFEELLKQEQAKNKAQEEVKLQTLQSKKDVALSFIEDLLPLIDYLNSNYVFKSKSGSGSLTTINKFPVQYSYQKYEFDIDGVMGEYSEYNNEVEFTILGTNLKIKVDNNFNLTIQYGWADSKERYVKTADEIEKIAMARVARLLEKKNYEGTSYPFSYFRFNKK